MVQEQIHFLHIPMSACQNNRDLRQLLEGGNELGIISFILNRAESCICQQFTCLQQVLRRQISAVYFNRDMDVSHGFPNAVNNIQHYFCAFLYIPAILILTVVAGWTYEFTQHKAMAAMKLDTVKACGFCPARCADELLNDLCNIFIIHLVDTDLHISPIITPSLVDTESQLGHRYTILAVYFLNQLAILGNQPVIVKAEQSVVEVVYRGNAGKTEKDQPNTALCKTLVDIQQVFCDMAFRGRKIFSCCRAHQSVLHIETAHDSFIK